MSKSQTVLQLKKVASVPYLYRHQSNGRFYGVKKHDGKIVRKSLKTSTGEPITTLQAAKAALSEWLVLLAAPSVRKSPFSAINSIVKILNESAEVNGVDIAAISPTAAILSQEAETPEDEWRIQRQVIDAQQRAQEIQRDAMFIAKEELLGESRETVQKRKEDTARSKTPTLAQCFDDFLVYKSGVRAGTLTKYKYVKRAFELYNGRPLLETPIAQITPSALAAFLGQLPGKPQYFNSTTLVINQVFEMVRLNKIIRENPFDMLPSNITHRKVQITRDVVPTIEQCEKIAASIRSQSAADTREESANICEFIHRAALGQAEINCLTWGDLDFERGIVRVKRIKTGRPFDVPLYPCLRPFLEELVAKSPKREPTEKIFKLGNIKKAIYAACERLGLPPYSPRDLRKARITWLLRKGYPVDLIADAQGHSDGGVLVRRVYSNVIDEARDAYKREQLAKLQ